MAQGIDHHRQHKWIISYYSIFQSFCIRLRLGTLRSYSRLSWTGMGGSLKTSPPGLPMFTMMILYYINVNADMVKMFISLRCVKYIWHHYHYHDQNNKFRSGTIKNDLYSQTGPCEQVPAKSPRVSGKKSHFQRTNEYPAIFSETLDIGFFILLYLKNNQCFMFCAFHDL